MLTRRQFSGLFAAAALTPVAGRSNTRPDSRIHIIDMANPAWFDRDAVPAGLDGTNACTRPNHGFWDTLVNAGVDTVLRYYSDENNAGLNCKNVTRRERDLLHDHGLALAIVYQFEGRSRDRYTGARAQADAAFCLARARMIGQPEGSAIYFGVDSDTAFNSDTGVLDYFRTVRAVFGGRFRVGIYAAGARCELIRDAGLADYFWVPEAPAWAGTRDFMNSGDWTLYQNKTNIDRNLITSGQGQTIHIDTDFINPGADTTIGGFTRDGSLKTYDPARIQAIADARFWVSEAKLDLFEYPGEGASGHVCIARMVHVLETDGDWAWVDTDEDGFADGYCRTSALAPLGRMPVWRSGDCKPMDI